MNSTSITPKELADWYEKISKFEVICINEYTIHFQGRTKITFERHKRYKCLYVKQYLSDEEFLENFLPIEGYRDLKLKELGI